MDLSVIVNGVISLFLIILVGVYAAKKRIITKEINKGLTNILLKITLPCLVVSSFIFDLSDELKDNIIRCFIYSPLVLIISIVISYILLIPIKGEKKIIIQFANVFSNCGFIGFPIVFSIYGNEGVIYASIFNLFFTAFLLLLFRNYDFKRLFRVLDADTIVFPTELSIQRPWDLFH